MTVWLWIALISNLVYWTIFFTLVARRRWNKPALAVGVLHMLFASLLVVAPIRSLIDPAYIGYQIGLFRFEGRATALPAAIFLLWSLAAAWSAVTDQRGRWLKAIAVGDLLFAGNLGVALLGEYLRGELNGTVIEFGEHLTLAGPLWAGVLMLVFVVPFVASARWAMRRAKAPLPPAPPAPDHQKQHKQNKHETPNLPSLRLANQQP